MTEYKLVGYQFKVQEFFPISIFEEITNVRVNQKEIIKEEARERKKRETITDDGKLTILATDHPGRMVTRVGDDSIAMSNRYNFLGRILRVLSGENFDGVMGTPDVIEDLFIISYLLKKSNGKSFLDEKIILGCMNRGGLQGSAFELNDRFTAFTVESISQLRLDGAKLMFCLDTSQIDSGLTLDYCARAIRELNASEIPVFLEPLAVKKSESGYKNVKEASAIVRVIGVATALGDSSRNLWLKIPYCENFEVVAKSTTCPLLMLGGEAKGDPTPTLCEFESGMKAGANVRGALVGRNILYPGDDDPMAVASAVHQIVHAGFSVDEAVDYIMKTRGKNIDIWRK